MSYIKLPYGFIQKSAPIKFKLPSNNLETQYLEQVKYLNNETDPNVQNKFLNVAKHRKDLGGELQENINSIVGRNEKFNNAYVRRALDLKNSGLSNNTTPLNLVFHDIKKFDTVNPLLGKIATQIKVKDLSEKEITRRRLGDLETAKIKDRLAKLKKKR